MYMILFVLDNPDHLDKVLDAWNDIGVSGVTIIESTGINRRRIARQIGKTFMAGLNRLMSSDIENHFTLLTIVPDQSWVPRCIDAAEAIVGDLSKPDSGVLAAWPLEIVKGVRPSLAEK